MAYSGQPSLDGSGGHGPAESIPLEEMSTKPQSRRLYNCHLIPHLPRGCSAGQVRRFLEVEAPVRESELVEVDLVASHPDANFGPSHESYAVVTSQRTGAEPKQVEPLVGLGKCPVVTMFNETAVAQFTVSNLTQQLLVKIEKQVNLLQLAELRLLRKDAHLTVITIAGTCSQLQLFREYLVKLLVQSILLVGGEDISTPQSFTSHATRKTGRLEDDVHTNVAPPPQGDASIASSVGAVSLSPSDSKPAGQSFTGLSSEVLFLMPKLPNGNIAGVEYFPAEGRVHITCASKEEEDACISQFQDVYQNRSRQLKTITIDVPPTFPVVSLQPLLEKFNGQYNQCHFMADPSNKNIRVISVSSRQFDQAKKFLTDNLRGNGTTTMALDTSVCDVIRMPHGRKLKLKKADIAQEHVDVIVNAANQQLLHSGGVAAALDAASKGELQRHSDQHTKQSGQVPVGDVCVTKGGGSLKCKYVIHAVGPMAGTMSDVLIPTKIASAVNKCLVEAQKLKAVSIAFPALSAGIFGVNCEISADAIIQTILSYKYPEAQHILSDVRIVIIDYLTHAGFASRMTQKQAEMKRENKAVDKTSGVPASTTPGQNSATAGTTDVDSDHHGLSGNSFPGFRVSALTSGRDASQHTSTSPGSSVPVSSQHQASTPVLTVPTSSNASVLPSSALPYSPPAISASEKIECPICLEKPIISVKMPCCQNVLCRTCCHKALTSSPYCPVCRKAQRKVTGNQPIDATMGYICTQAPLPGYPSCGRIIITYRVPDGFQTREHPNPGAKYVGTTRTAYLPDNTEGQEVLRLLRCAFNARLIFTIGTSHSTGLSNVVVWNDIHHKTSASGGAFGYPDPTYLARVKQELNDRGIS